MGKFEFDDSEIADNKLTINWGSLTEQQKQYVGKAYDYPEDSSVPLMVFVMHAILVDLSAKIDSLYVNDNIADIQAAASIVSDITPE